MEMGTKSWEWEGLMGTQKSSPHSLVRSYVGGVPYHVFSRSVSDTGELYNKTELIMPPPRRGGGALSGDRRLSSVCPSVCLSV